MLWLREALLLEATSYRNNGQATIHHTMLPHRSTLVFFSITDLSLSHRNNPFPNFLFPACSNEWAKDCCVQQRFCYCVLSLLLIENEIVACSNLSIFQVVMNTSKKKNKECHSSCYKTLFPDPWSHFQWGFHGCFIFCACLSIAVYKITTIVNQLSHSKVRISRTFCNALNVFIFKKTIFFNTTNITLLQLHLDHCSRNGLSRSVLLPVIVFVSMICRATLSFATICKW